MNVKILKLSVFYFTSVSYTYREVSNSSCTSLNSKLIHAHRTDNSSFYFLFSLPLLTSVTPQPQLFKQTCPSTCFLLFSLSKRSNFQNICDEDSSCIRKLLCFLKVYCCTTKNKLTKPLIHLLWSSALLHVLQDSALFCRLQ